MTQITISSKADLNAKDHPAVHAYGKAGEELQPCSPVILKADGNGNFRYYVAKGADVLDGISEPKVVPAGAAVAVFGTGMRFHASDAGALTPGRYGMTATPRVLDTASANPKYFRAVSKTDLQVISLG